MSEQKFPPRVWIKQEARKWGTWPRAYYTAVIDAQEYLSLGEHQHLMAENERRIERLEYCLEWLAAGFGGMWGSETKMWYDHALETAPDMIKAALQEDWKCNKQKEKTK